MPAYCQQCSHSSLWLPGLHARVVEHQSQQMLAVALGAGVGAVHMGVTAVVALEAGAGGALPGPKRPGLATGPAPTATTYVSPAGDQSLCQPLTMNQCLPYHGCHLRHQLKGYALRLHDKLAHSSLK